MAEAQSFYDATAQSIIDADNALDDARRALAELTGQDVGAVAALRDEIPLTLPSPATPDEWLKAAREENFDVRAAAIKTAAMLRAVDVSRSKTLPTLSIQGGDSRQFEPDAFGGRQDLDSIGVMMNWPLFQGGLVRSQVRQAQALAMEAQAQQQLAVRDSERHARAAFRAVTTGVERIRVDHQAVQSAQAAVDASRRGVEFGTRTEFDLLNSQNNYYNALRTYNQSRYDYLQAVLTLKLQAGRLAPDDLAGIDDMLVTNARAAAVPAAPINNNPGEARHVP